jgi:imidazolonepropionase-like amidohydrolase
MKFNKEYALTKATLIDGNGRSPVKNAVVIVKDGKIEKVGGKETINSKDGIPK